MSEQNLNFNKYLSSTKDFLESNSLVAKIAFLLLVLLAFVIVLKICLTLIGYIFLKDSKTILVNGMIDATQTKIITQDPSISGSKTIYRSENANEGIEFSYSVWIYIENMEVNRGKYKCIFYKGNEFSNNRNNLDTGLNFPNNAPGLYIAPNSNDLIVLMNTFNVINEKVSIPNIPLNKWVNVIIRVENNKLDVYINGTITKRMILEGVVKQNSGDVYVCVNGGYGGYMSLLTYYDYGLGISEIEKIVSKGPNLKMIDSNGLDKKNANYLSLRWFFYGMNDSYNP